MIKTLVFVFLYMYAAKKMFQVDLVESFFCCLLKRSRDCFVVWTFYEGSGTQWCCSNLFFKIMPPVKVCFAEL